jgi:hypothetical protein
MNWQRDALIAIEKLRARTRQLEYEQIEPIALVNVAAADLFKYPTIDTLAEYLGRRRIEGTRSADNEVVGAGMMVDDSVPATRMSEEIQRLIENEYEATVNAGD